MFHLQRQLELKNLKSEYFTQMIFEKFTRVYILRARLPTNLDANERATNITNKVSEDSHT